MDRKLQLLESFMARGSDGQDYKVRAYEHVVRDDSLTDGTQRWESTGVAEYKLDDGRPVQSRADDVMTILGTDVTLRRDDGKGAADTPTQQRTQALTRASASRV